MRGLKAHVSTVALGGLLSLLSWSGVAAQTEAAGRASNWELNLHAAAMRPALFDETTQALQFGGRILRNFSNGLSVGGNVDWAKADDVTLAPFAGLGASLLLYSAELEYGIPVSPRSTFFVAAGVGAATVSLDDAPFGAASSSTGLLVPAGGGVKIHNRAMSPSWAIRFDLRDNVILLETLGAEGTETEPRHNVEASVGVSFLFGGGSPAVGAERDADRDGVPDPRDFCLNRAGAPVDARGCPLDEEDADQERIPEPEAAVPVAGVDADQDNVPDVEDGCLGTPAGIQVGIDGCPLLPGAAAPPEAAVPSEAGDEDGDGVADDVDGCPGTPPGIPTDDRGCLARPEPAQDAPEDEAVAPVPAPPAGAVGPADETACLDPSEGRRAIEFDGRRFEPAGFPQPVDRRFLIRVGAFEGLPIYVSDTAQQPYGDFWVPRCGDDGSFELYVETGALP
jgi:hypothetical protein